MLVRTLEMAQRAEGNERVGEWRWGDGVTHKK